jgi:hypothetical protein
MPSDNPTELPGHPTAADREIQREKLVHEIRAMGGLVPDSNGRTSETELEFFRQVIAWEKGPFITQRAWFERRGMTFALPEQLGGGRLEKELWRLIAALAEARVFLACTNHLSDAQLYNKLVHEVLDDEVPDLARSPNEGLHWDFSESDSADPLVWLTYYATEDQRRDWLEEFPDIELPPRREPPFDRDRHLPVGI